MGQDKKFVVVVDNDEQTEISRHVSEKAAKQKIRQIVKDGGTEYYAIADAALYDQVKADIDLEERMDEELSDEVQRDALDRFVDAIEAGETINLTVNMDDPAIKEKLEEEVTVEGETIAAKNAAMLERDVAEGKLPPENPESRAAAKKDAEEATRRFLAEQAVKGKRISPEDAERFIAGEIDMDEARANYVPDSPKRKAAKGNGDKKKAGKEPKAEKQKVNRNNWSIYVQDEDGANREVVAEGLTYKGGDPVMRETIASNPDRVTVVVNTKNGNEYPKLGANVREIRRARKAAERSAQKAADQRKKEGEAEKAKASKEVATV